jgi:hypothetical protein
MTSIRMAKMSGMGTIDHNPYRARHARGRKKVRSPLLTPEAAAAAKARRELRKG